MKTHLLLALLLSCALYTNATTADSYLVTDTKQILQTELTRDLSKNKLFSTRYLINKKEVDSISYKILENKLIEEIKLQYQIGQQVTFKTGLSQTEKTGTITGSKYNAVLVTCDSLKEYEVPVETTENYKLEVSIAASKRISYNQLKAVYGYEKYKYKHGDPYLPWLNATVSVFIPGSGQLITGEFLRGAGFLGAEAVSFFSIIYGALENWGSGGSSGMFWVYAGTTGMIVFPVWSAVDAYKISGVRNLYLRDKKQYNNIQISILPYSKPVPYSFKRDIETGLALNIRF